MVYYGCVSVCVSERSSSDLVRLLLSCPGSGGKNLTMNLKNRWLESGGDNRAEEQFTV